MNFSIIESSTYIQNILHQTSENGQVHSTYHRTINLMVKNNLLAIQAKGSPLSPISMIVNASAEELESLCISPGDSIQISLSAITIGAHSFSFAHTIFHDLALTNHIASISIASIKDNTNSMICASNCGGFESIFNHRPSVDTSLMLQIARNRMLTTKTLLHSGDYANAAVELSKLLGLGIGLTPSGDDFLCGALAALDITSLISQSVEVLSFQTHLQDEIHTHLNDTNDISKAFLISALQSNYSLAVNQLAEMPSFDRCLKAFQAIGHSSGIDTLCGISFILGIFS